MSGVSEEHSSSTHIKMNIPGLCVLYHFCIEREKENNKSPLLTNDVDTPYFHTHLEGIFNTILSHSFIVLLRGSYFICHVTQNEEGLLSSDADQFTRVWPEDLGKLKTRGKNSKGQNEIEKISELVTLLENRLKRIKTKSKPVLRVWAGSRCDGSALCSPSHKTPGHSLTSPQARNLHRFLQKRNTSSEQYSGNFSPPNSEVFHRTMFTLPSAPKSGLKDFFSLKFLKILTILLLSLMAYLL